jgi:hypothetical protein
MRAILAAAQPAPLWVLLVVLVAVKAARMTALHLLAIMAAIRIKALVAVVLVAASMEAPSLYPVVRVVLQEA